MNCTAIMECILKEHEGFVFGKQYIIDDETLYRIEEDNQLVEVIYLDELTRMDIRMSQELIIFWDDDYSVVLR